MQERKIRSSLTLRTLSKVKSVNRKTLAFILCLLVTLSFTIVISAQKTATRTFTPPAKSSKSANIGAPLRKSQEAQMVAQGHPNSDGSITPDKLITDKPIERTVAELMADQAASPSKEGQVRPRKKKERPNRENLPQAPGALEESQYPLRDKNASVTQFGAPQTLGTQFDGATGPTETGAFPPDTEGAVGPTQVFIFINGRMRTFNKTTGVADGVINADPDIFFASVLTSPGAGEVVFTSDPNVRFDRLTNRWFLNIIDVVLNASTGAITRANRVLIAVSDAASNGNITAGTVWTFYQFQGDAALFTDYQSFGIDASAMYIGGDMFTTAGAFTSTKGFVIPKAPALTASPLTVWAFSGLVATPTGAGPFAPRGVDNYDPANTGAGALGYFIGVDNATFNTLMIRRVTNPGSLGPAPTISANISVPTPLTTRFPVVVPHLGNTGGTGGRLDALDDRLYAAHLRNGSLWTTHNVGVNNTGVAGATNNRNAARWYELQNLNATPSVLQSGTLFDNNAVNDANQRNYWIPSIMVSGQGHAALGCSIAGTNERINAFTTGRLTGDTLGALRDGPGGAALPGYTASSTAYNPPGDPGGPSRRWGDYSLTVLDPKDDMTMWTIQEYCNGTNTYGVRVVKLIAPPPPPTNTPVPASVAQGIGSTNIVVTGTAPAGQGFYDPGTDPAAPHTPFTHISASGAGIIVNSITYNTRTQVTLNVSTVGSTTGARTITITNPDGQTTTVDVTVAAGASCVLTCPSNITTSADAGICTAIVNYTAPTTAGPCGTVICVPPAGSSFPKGTTTVNCSEPGGATCSFTVTVNDTQNPVLTCPTNQTATSPGGAVTVNYPAPTATDNCTGVGTPTCNPASGSLFPVGATTVNCSVTDASANTAMCSFTVTVSVCTLSCPGNITVPNTANQCGATVTYSNPTTSGGCGTVTCSPASGSFFTAGTTTVTCSEPSGGSCSFTVTVNYTDVPTITPGGPTTFCAGGSVTLTSSSVTGNQWNLDGNPIAGATNQTYSATASGSYTVTVTNGSCASTSTLIVVTVNPAPPTPAITPGGPTTFCAGGSVTLTSSSATGNQWYMNGNAIGGAINQTYNATASGNYTLIVITSGCSSAPSAAITLTVSDTTPPSITCPTNQTVNSAASTSVSYPLPTVSDNCSGVGTPTCTPPSGSIFPVGTTTVNCAVADGSNNNASCSFTVTVIVCTITCPTNMVRANDPNQCGAVTTFAPSATPGCGTVVCSPASGSFFPIGTTTVTCITSAGPSCSFSVTINDAQPPAITCPANLTAIITNPATSCVVANYATVASDNCSGVGVVCSPASGSCFPLGVTTVTCTATDGSGNTASCSFTVSVFDICIQDDANAGTVILINSVTGAYRFCCNGSVFTGTGKVRKKGTTVTLEHNSSTGKVYGKVDRSTFTGTGWIQRQGNYLCTITDRDIRDNSCICQ